jgi:hypothetical protein
MWEHRPLSKAVSLYWKNKRKNQNFAPSWIEEDNPHQWMIKGVVSRQNFLHNEAQSV